ncbi:MAG: hypothetical protein JW860_02735 [Sedimentisphaerales bacterium]|nr:hypothetical protein [Sedimentisphaerales bacterium]
MSNRLLELNLYHLRIPLRSWCAWEYPPGKYVDTVISAALLADGTVGYGEGVPGPHITGETVDSVFFNIGDSLVESLKNVEPKTLSDIFDLVDNLPFTNPQGQTINAARCCVELALLDAYSHYFKRPLTTVSDWLGYSGFSAGGSIDKIRVSGALFPGTWPLGTQLLLMRWYGLRDFKLNLNGQYDQENLERVYFSLKHALQSLDFSLRVDANGAWDIDTATALSKKLHDYSIISLEQPLSPNDHSHLHTIASLSPVPLMADESLVSLEDGQFLAQNDFTDYFNIGISKNGGLLPALRLAELALKSSLGIQLGAAPGETGVLAAAGRKFLQMIPNIDFTEICYSSFMLDREIVTPKMRFTYGGRLIPTKGPGLGIRVRRDKIAQFLAKPPGKITLA